MHILGFLNLPQGLAPLKTDILKMERLYVQWEMAGSRTVLQLQLTHFSKNQQP